MWCLTAFTSEICEFWHKNAAHVKNHGKSLKTPKFTADAKIRSFHQFREFVTDFGLVLYMLPQWNEKYIYFYSLWYAASLISNSNQLDDRQFCYLPCQVHRKLCGGPLGYRKSSLVVPADLNPRPKFYFWQSRNLSTKYSCQFIQFYHLLTRKALQRPITSEWMKIDLGL